MEPESSSPYPQVPATRPYPEPTPSTSWRSILISSSHLHLGVSPTASFPQASPPTPCAPLYPPPYAPNALPTKTIQIQKYRILNKQFTSNMVGKQCKRGTKVRAPNPEKNIDNDDDNDKRGATLPLFLRRLCHNIGQVSAGDERKDNTSVYNNLIRINKINNSD